MAGRTRRRWTEEEKRTRKKTKKRTMVSQDSTDDDEANQDMTVRILEKAKQKKSVMEEEDLKAADSPDSSAVINILPSDVIGLAEPLELEGLRRKERRIKRKKKKGDHDGEKAEDKKLEVQNSSEAMVGEPTMSDNTVLRKLLRGPRYFDPPDESWGACYSCGEVGHSAAKCVLAKHKKPCHICGKLGHTAHSCPEAHTCFICKKTGHRAKKCLERHNVEKDDNSREIRCYVCRQNGHLCCVDYVTDGPIVVSYGTHWLGCARHKSRKMSILCYKCGEEGHIARGCNVFDQYGPRSSEPRTPQNLPRKDLGFVPFRSVPHDFGKSHGTREVPLLHKQDARFTAGNFRPVKLWRTSDIRVNGWGSPAIATPIGPAYQVPSIHSSVTPIPWGQRYMPDSSCSWNHHKRAVFADPNFSGRNGSNR